MMVLSPETKEYAILGINVNYSNGSSGVPPICLSSSREGRRCDYSVLSEAVWGLIKNPLVRPEPGSGGELPSSDLCARSYT